MDNVGVHVARHVLLCESHLFVADAGPDSLTAHGVPEYSSISQAQACHSTTRVGMGTGLGWCTLFTALSTDRISSGNGLLGPMPNLGGHNSVALQSRICHESFARLLSHSQQWFGNCRGEPGAPRCERTYAQTTQT